MKQFERPDGPIVALYSDDQPLADDGDDTVVAVDWSEHQVAVSLTRDQFQNAPSIDEDAPVSRKYERSYMGHYGWPAYWGGMFAWGAWPVPFLPDDRPRAEGGDSVEEQDEGDTHLRSVKEVTGYHIHATDDAIGHVEDFIIDDESWEVRYLVVDTSNWWFGKRVLSAPAWVTSVEWLDRRVHVNLLRAQVKAAPEFDPSMPQPCLRRAPLRVLRAACLLGLIGPGHRLWARVQKAQGVIRGSW